MCSSRLEERAKRVWSKSRRHSPLGCFCHLLLNILLCFAPFLSPFAGKGLTVECFWCVDLLLLALARVVCFCHHYSSVLNAPVFCVHTTQQSRTRAKKCVFGCWFCSDTRARYSSRAGARWKKNKTTHKKSESCCCCCCCLFSIFCSFTTLRGEAPVQGKQKRERHNEEEANRSEKKWNYK